MSQGDHVNSAGAAADASDPTQASAVTFSGTTRLRRWITLAGSVLIALIIAAEVHEAIQHYRTTLSDNEHTQRILGRVLSEQAARMVQEVDVVISDYAAWVASPEGQAAAAPTVRERLRSDLMRLPFVHSAVLASLDGHVLATTQSDSPADSRLPNDQVFTIPERALDSALHIGQPFIGTRDGARTFALSRRVDPPESTFDGIVVARIAFEYLTGFYAGVSVAPDMSIRLLRDDGIVLAQYPASGNDPIADDPYVRLKYSGSTPAKEEVLYSTSNGIDTVAALRMVEGYPIVVAVTRPLSSVLRPWIQTELGSAARSLTLVLLAAMLLVTLRWALSRHDRAEFERRGLEQELDNAQRLEALGILAASVAHDFNNVLTAIVGYGELAHQSVATGTPESSSLERLLAAAERARLLVRRILTVNPRQQLRYVAVRIEPIVAEVVQQLTATLPACISVQVKGLEPDATILGDATEIHQVVMNLCSNAVQAMPEGGQLEVRIASVEQREARVLTLGQLHAGSWICVSVVDTGIGLTHEQIHSVFKPFYTTRPPEQGTGIGLTVVRSIVARTNGALEVESRPGSGTRMSVYWLRAAPSASDQSELPSGLPLAGQGETVMVVDDRQELVTLAEEVLASLGYEPVGFTGAQAALAAYRRDPSRFDAIVTDERMSPLRGCELAKLVHAVDPRVPVILVTGYRDVELEARAKQAGIAEVLDKPLRAQTLSAALSRQLAAAGPVPPAL